LLIEKRSERDRRGRCINAAPKRIGAGEGWGGTGRKAEGLRVPGKRVIVLSMGAKSKIRKDYPDGQEAHENPRSPIELPTFRGKGLRPGVDLDDSAALLELMNRSHDPD
jgi:hypothetical protein